MRHSKYLSFLTLLVALFFVSCAQEDNAIPVPPPPEVTPVTPLVVGPAGFFAQSNPSSITNVISYSPTSNYKTFIEEMMGVCNRGIFNYSNTPSNCNSWTGGNSYHMMMLTTVDTSANQVEVVFMSQPALTNFAYDFSLYLYNPSAARNPLKIVMYPWPKGNGFQLRANGPPDTKGYKKIIIIDVPNGKLTDTYWDFTLRVLNGSMDTDGTVMATGRANICAPNQPRCGLPF